MKKLLVLILIAVAMHAGATVFEDDFEASTIDASKWSTDFTLETTGFIDGANWLKAGSASGSLTTELISKGRIGKPLVSQVVVTDDQWHHVGLTWDGSTRILYVDDIEVARDTQGRLIASDGTLIIGGGSKKTPDSFWLGIVDDVRIYDRAIEP